MKILVVGLNYSPELTGIGKYTGEMAEWLAARGHEVRVVTAPPYYPQWNIQKPYKSYLYKMEVHNGVLVYRCPLYVPKNITTLTRIIHLFSFALSSFPVLIRQLFWRPDIVINPVPSLFSSPMAALVAKLSGGKSVLHIQDYEVDAMLGLGMAESGLVGKLARTFERLVLTSFDKVSTISHSMMDKAKEKGVSEKNILFFPNWSDTSRFADVKPSNALRVELGVSGSNKLILYSGNIGEKQGLEQLIEAADILKDKPYDFVIVGDGGGREKLISLAVGKQLTNVHFSPLLPIEQLPILLASADCHLVIQKRGVADVVLPSKLTNILAVGGNVVITAESNTELGLLCEKYAGIAELVEPENVDALITGIEKALYGDRPNLIAANYAKEKIDYHQVISAFEKNLLEL
ncbi:glycosyltransferase WbuB [Zhongshania sp. BJYM1]|uniref:glycosyltransferase WbuB n=1 Tax=Zhongshania aquatica TaxID=2965069 RepID=UPI0022B55F89|nr:glycosyltransferase WbuB [Marortus sp. BJYM1]